MIGDAREWPAEFMSHEDLLVLTDNVHDEWFDPPLHEQS